MEYGIAFENFFNLEFNLIKIFALLSLIATFQMAIFFSFDSGKVNDDSTVLDRLTFASLGQATSVCSKMATSDKY